MIDWTRVEELRSEVGAEDFADVVELFVEEVSAAIRTLPQVAAEGRLEEAMHFLKGSSASLGFRTFSELCRQGEQMAAAGRAQEIDLDAMATEFSKSKVEFLSGLAA
ncbi:Hpt domain-containing protein [Chachezhania sediminis]|uniref:Hpt domain-containing protein n=1 Tax=Chachezhania sediminis TaxID=2599291 RepID=UPI00131A8FE7|nr:Hpt domain-containing protein [Chachezhania sediminis]